MRSRIHSALWLFVLFLWPIYTAQATLTPSGPIIINGQNGTVMTGLKITNPNGDCVQITNSTNITIKESEIGPCMGNGIRINGGSGHHIYDNYIHVENRASGCCDTRNNILIQNGAKTIDIQGNVLTFGETNVEVNCSNGNECTAISMIGNYSLNPRGPFPRGQHWQSWGSSGNLNSGMLVSRNYMRSISGQTYTDDTEDFINFGFSQNSTISQNYVDGTGGNLSLSGTAMIADAGSQSITFSQNIIYNTGHVGLAATVGYNHDFNGNKVFIDNVVTGFNDPGSATGISIFNNDGPCGDIQVRNNIVYLRQNDGDLNAIWVYQCSNVIQTNNTLNMAAYNILNPMSSTNPPPLIPPLPKNCTAVSPHTTQTSMAACGGVSDPDPVPDAPTNLRIVSP